MYWCPNVTGAHKTFLCVQILLNIYYQQMFYNHIVSVYNGCLWPITNGSDPVLQQYLLCVLSCLWLAHWKLSWRGWETRLINQNQCIKMTAWNTNLLNRQASCVLTEQILCDCATGWKTKRNYGTFPHQSFNSLRGNTVRTGAATIK